MKLLYDKSFLKDLDKLKNKQVKTKIFSFIETIKKSDSLSGISNIKKMMGYQDFYRYKISSYRLGFQYIDKTIILIVIKHRKDIYKRFP